VYFKSGHLACRRCQDAVYASQVCDKHPRPALQAIKLGNFLSWKTYIPSAIASAYKHDYAQKQHNSQRTLPANVSARDVSSSSSNYSTRGLMHWR